MGISGLVIGQDVTTAIFGALNAGYFSGYLWQSTARRSRTHRCRRADAGEQREYR